MKTNILNIHDLVLLLTSLECIVLASVLKLLPSRQEQSRNILAVFFVLVALVLTTTVIVWNAELKSAAINQTPVVLAFLTFAMLLEGPVLFFYLRSLSKSVNLYRPRHLLHTLPAVLAVLVVLVFQINSVDWQPTTPIVGVKKVAIALVWAMTKLVPVIYILASIWAEYKLRQSMKDHYSTISLSELKLADAVLLGFCVHWLWSLLAYVLEEFVSASMDDLMGIANNYLTVFLVNGLFVFGLINTRQWLAPAVVVPAKPVVEPELEPETDAKLASRIAAIEKGIHTRKLYLESNINLERFSEQIGLRPRDTSAVLKAHYQVNFFEFINGYRVEEAKRLLSSPEFQEETILELIYKSGFNSPSAFHRFFKRIVGMTPTEFRKQALPQANVLE